MASTEDTSLSIILADNQALTAAGIKYLFSGKKQLSILEAVKKEELFRLADRSPALVIMDYRSIDNFRPTHMAELRQRFTGVPVLVITSDEDKATILKVLETGVNGFLFKNCGQDEILRAVDAILEGEKFYCNKVFDILMESRQQQAAEDCLPTELTAREVEIIKLVVKAKSTADIAEKLHLSPHTVSTHRKNIIRKLKIKSPVELVTYAYDLGLMDTMP